MPRLVCRRRGLYQPSIHSKIAADSCSVLAQVRVSSSSRCIVNQNDPTIVLWTELATRPIEPSSHAARSLWPKAQEV